MREIKFRAWHIPTKTMQKVRKFDLMGGHIYAGVFIGNYGWNDGSDAFELMQFTGLLDRHGKEIYEGDIVEEKVPGKEYRKTEVKWNQSNLGFYFYNSGTDFIEVIGNIYENPDLIKS